MCRRAKAQAHIVIGNWQASDLQDDDDDDLQAQLSYLIPEE